MNTKASRASRLLEQLIEDGVFDEDTLASALTVEPATLAEYRSGAPMPLQCQLSLAQLLIERAPASYKRLGHQLQAQVQAATSYGKRVNAFGGLPVVERPRR